MKFAAKIFSLSLIVFIIGLFITTPVLAIPSLPSSFYGTVKVNSANVPDGTLIQALIDGQVYAEAYTQTYQGSSVYALDVRGDDNETAAQDGGREADTVQFKIGGVFASQTAVWHSGTNVSLNLTASSSGSIAAPKATPTPVPTQTAIAIAVQPTQQQSSTIDQASSTSESIMQSTQTAIQLSQSQPSPISTVSGESQSQPTAVVLNDKNNSSSSPALIVGIIIAIVAIAIGFAFQALRKKNKKHDLQEK